MKRQLVISTSIDLVRIAPGMGDCFVDSGSGGGGCHCFRIAIGK